MSNVSKRVHVCGLLVLLLMAALLFQLTPAAAIADGTASEPPFQQIDTSGSGTHYAPIDEPSIKTPVSTVSLLDILLALAPLL